MPDILSIFRYFIDSILSGAYAWNFLEGSGNSRMGKGTVLAVWRDGKP